MNRKLSIIAVIVVLLLLVGCAGYQTPSYKSPDTTDAFEEDLEDTETEDASSDLGSDEDFDVDDIFDDEYDDEFDSTPTTTTTTTSSKPVAEKDGETYEKATYRPVAPVGTTTASSTSGKSMTVTAGSLVKLNVKANDADGDSLTYTFSKPLNSRGEWQTQTGDAGEYFVTVSVSDGKTTVDKDLQIIVEPKNNKPLLSSIKDVVVDEGQTVTLNVFATDADGDRLTTTFSGWMDGPTKTTDYNDAGTYTVKVTVTDGISKVSQDVQVTVKDVNRPPTVEIEF